MKLRYQINASVGNTFGRVLRAFLRQDPDVMMIGEIRDLETAEIAVQASLTGHLVFSTLHTNDAAGAVTRLVDWRRRLPDTWCSAPCTPTTRPAR